MADACPKCKGLGWFWNGQRRVTCRHPRPSQVHIIPVAEWPAYSARLMARRRL